ncbi:hypothetical protein PG996_013427 [Apiospora saccharicola]|uniref:Uncharacterized protein n=1 Tax=Apiospora saccharicola TaxID=335842 RepID=A0ABR1U7I4_9PEZI
MITSIPLPLPLQSHLLMRPPLVVHRPPPPVPINLRHHRPVESEPQLLPPVHRRLGPLEIPPPPPAALTKSLAPLRAPVLPFREPRHREGILPLPVQHRKKRVDGAREGAVRRPRRNGHRGRGAGRLARRHARRDGTEAHRPRGDLVAHRVFGGAEIALDLHRILPTIFTRNDGKHGIRPDGLRARQAPGTRMIEIDLVVDGEAPHQTRLGAQVLQPALEVEDVPGLLDPEADAHQVVAQVEGQELMAQLPAGLRDGGGPEARPCGGGHAVAEERRRVLGRRRGEE